MWQRIFCPFNGTMHGYPSNYMGLLQAHDSPKLWLLEKRFDYDIYINNLGSLSGLFACFRVLSRAFACFRVLSRAFACFRVLSRAFACFRVLSRSFACFRVLSHAFTCFHMLSHAFTCFRVLEHCVFCIPAQHCATFYNNC
jgi:hypothetical protein